MAMLSQTLRNLKFMKNTKQKEEKVVEKTFSYYACNNIVSKFENSPKKPEFKTLYKDRL